MAWIVRRTATEFLLPRKKNSKFKEFQGISGTSIDSFYSMDRYDGINLSCFRSILIPPGELFFAIEIKLLMPHLTLQPEKTTCKVNLNTGIIIIDQTQS